MSGKSEAAKKILEKLLKKTGDVAADDAARAALRKNPEQYAEYLKALDTAYGPTEKRILEHFPENKKTNQMYKDQHTAPNLEGNSPLHDLTKEGTFPSDIYSNKAQRYYGHGDEQLDKASLAIINKLKNKPDDLVSIYRSVPKDVKEINPGDWVSISKEYATRHGENRLGENNFNVLEKKVPASQVYNQGDIHEFGFDPRTRVDSAAFDPRFKDSKDVLAGGAVIPMGGVKLPQQSVPPTEDNKKSMLSNIVDKIKAAANPDTPIARALQNPVEIKPQDEQTRAKNLRNILVDKLGLPQDWSMSVADEKRWLQDLPEQMGTTGGTIGKVKKLTAAEQILAQRAAGKTGPMVIKTGADAVSDLGKVTVKKTAQEAVEEANKLKMAQARPTVNPADQARNLETDSGKRLKQLRDQRDKFEIDTKEQQQAQKAYQSLLQEMVDKIRNR